MINGEFDVGQMLRDVNIISVEDLERAVQASRGAEQTLTGALKKEATWSSFKTLLNTDVFSRRNQTNGGGLREVLDRAGWISAKQLGLVLEAIDQCDERLLAERLNDAGLLTPDELQRAQTRQSDNDKPLWRVLVNYGFVDVRKIAECLGIENRLFGRVLVSQELVEPDVMSRYLERAEGGKYSVARQLVDDEILDAEVVARCWAELYDVPFCDVSEVEPQRELLTHFRAHDLSEYMVIPLDLDGAALTVALGDPRYFSRLKSLASVAGTRIEAVVSPISQLAVKIDEIHRRTAADVASAPARELTQIDPNGLPADIVQATLSEARAKRGSDLHFDPQRDQLLVRVRVDGVLHELASVPASTGSQIVARLKALANLEISDDSRPQEGRLSTRVDDRLVDMRIATLPTKYGQKVVVRLAHARPITDDLTSLGLTPDQSESLSGFLGNHDGLVLSAGPVGSGTTTTLYAALGQLNVPEKNLITLEEPIEYSLPRVNQIEVSSRSGFSYADGLRSILRYDPDVVMLGEIRDHETARVAVRTAMSGVLVMSSLACDDASEALANLIDLGVSPYLVAHSLRGVVAQRLARCVCTSCAVRYTPSPQLVEELGCADDSENLEFKRGQGCTDCLGTGYLGRIGLFEVLPICDGIRRQILDGSDRHTLRRAAIEAGMRTLADDAREKLRRGMISAEEYLKQLHA